MQVTTKHLHPLTEKDGRIRVQVDGETTPSGAPVCRKVFPVDAREMLVRGDAVTFPGAAALVASGAISTAPEPAPSPFAGLGLDELKALVEKAIEDGVEIKKPHGNAKAPAWAAALHASAWTPEG